MSKRASDPDEGKDADQTAKRRQRLGAVVGSLGTAVGVTAAAYPLRGVEDSLPGAVVLLGLVIASTVAVVSRRVRSDHTVQESKLRLREAETELDQALRSDSARRALIQSYFLATHSDPPVPIPEAEANPEGDLTLPAVWKVTNRRLTVYHDIAVSQAKRSFRNAQYAMLTGFLLLGGFVGVALKVKSTPASVTATALGAAAAALSGYIANTFIKSQQMASTALRSYFDQPLEMSRYLAAERVVRDAGLSDGLQAELLRELVHKMINGPGPTPALPEPNTTVTEQPE